MNKQSVIAAMVAGVALFAVDSTFGLHAQEAKPAVKRNIVMKQDMVSVPGKEGVMALVELPPGAAEGRHTHPAEVYFFVLEGAVTQELEGSPTVTLKAGDVFHIPPNTIHQATNNGTVPAKLAVVFIADKGKPLTTPAK